MAYSNLYTSWPGSPDNFVSHGVPTALDPQNSSTIGDPSKMVRQLLEFSDNVQAYLATLISSGGGPRFTLSYNVTGAVWQAADALSATVITDADFANCANKALVACTAAGVTPPSVAPTAVAGAGGAADLGDHYALETYTTATGETFIGKMVGFTVAGANKSITITDPGSWPAGVTKATAYVTKTNTPTLASHEVPDYSAFYKVGDILAAGGNVVYNVADTGLGGSPTSPSDSDGGSVTVIQPLGVVGISVTKAVQLYNNVGFFGYGRDTHLLAASTFDNATGRHAVLGTAAGNTDTKGAMVDAYQCDRLLMTGFNVDGGGFANRCMIQKRTRGSGLTYTNTQGGDKSTTFITLNEFHDAVTFQFSVGLPNDTNDNQAATSNLWLQNNRIDGPSSSTGLDINIGDGHYYINNITGGSPGILHNGVSVISIVGGHISGSASGNIKSNGGGSLFVLDVYLDNIQGSNTGTPTGGGIYKPSGLGAASNWRFIACHFNLNHATSDGANLHLVKEAVIASCDFSGVNSNYAVCLRGINDKNNAVALVGCSGGGNSSILGWWNPDPTLASGGGVRPGKIIGCVSGVDGTAGMSENSNAWNFLGAKMAAAATSVTITHGLLCPRAATASTAKSTNGSPVINITANPLSNSSNSALGMALRVVGAGAGGADLWGRIIAIAGNNVTLDVNAGTTIATNTALWELWVIPLTTGAWPTGADPGGRVWIDTYTNTTFVIRVSAAPAADVYYHWLAAL